VTSPGEVLNRRYRLLERLGEGSMGSVWKAQDTFLERTVAVKELICDRYGAEPVMVRRERVRREALAMAKVEHPAIVTIHDLIYVGSSKDPWIVMAYMRGRPLASIIRQDPPLGAQKVASIGLAVLAGLRACHESSVYHRDVKPANIVVGPDGSVHLVDFGIARILGEDTLTAESKVLGTLEFLAPELLNGRSAGAATDLWALGVTLYYALTGKAPFRAETEGATIAAIFSRNPPEPRGGGAVADVVLQMLRKRPQDRPDGAAVAAALRGGAATTVLATPAAPRQDRPAGVPRQQPPGYHRDAIQPIRQVPRMTPLSGLPVRDAAEVVADWPADKAARELVALGETEAANIVNRCDDPVGGKLLSAIAADHPARARKILEMVTVDRAGLLLDHMSSVAAASALSLPPSATAVRVLGRADTPTVVGALSEMPPHSAASVVLAMDEPRAVEVLGHATPATVAAILRNVSLAGRGQALLDRLPGRFRGLLACQDLVKLGRRLTRRRGAARAGPPR
jgi:tRNA A-37 threonylcarbamoyl transferase component Bud32/flagellar motility protein MotE (MotC chaperone)